MKHRNSDWFRLGACVVITFLATLLVMGEVDVVPTLMVFACLLSLFFSRDSMDLDE